MEPLRNAAKVAFAVVVMVSLVVQSLARPKPDEIEEMKIALYSVCSRKHPITEEMRSNAKTGVFSEDRSFKCFMMCAFDELSLIDEEGEIDGETIASMVIDSLKPSIEKAIQVCLPNIAGKPDPCEVTYNFLNCAQKVDLNLAQMLPV